MKPKDGAPDDGGDGDPASPDRVAPVVENVTGRVKFDDRGNAVWEWAVSTGKFGTEVSSKRLKKLENPSLSISEDGAPPPAGPARSADPAVNPARTTHPAATPPRMPGTAPAAVPVKENRKGVTQGYSPYDSGLLVKGGAQRPKKKDLRRLGEWLKLREQANRNKRDDD